MNVKVLQENPYRMTVDLNVLDHLGINLYSNIAAVLTEAVANSWDADATICSISINADEDTIEINDDGVGMTIDDMNNKYLRVGYRRREEDKETGKLTSKGRPTMGRKGLGKLSLFSIADKIEIHSSKDGERHGLVMTTEGIQESVTKHSQEYCPIAVDPKEISIQNGTLIRLSKIKRRRLGRGVTALRKKLSRRFSVAGKKYNFEVMINDEPLSSADRGDLPKTQFIWYLGQDEPDLDSAVNLKEKEPLPDRLEKWKESWKVTGWLGTSRFPKELDDEEAGNLNSIVVFARGRLFHENILDRLNDGRLYTKYLTGQIEADFLDADEEPDIATSDRQRIQEDDPRYVALIEFLKEQTSAIEKRWNEWRKKHEVKKAKEENPILVEWLNTLPGGFRGSAESLIAKISSLPVDKDDDRKLMYKHGILAFERMRLRGSTEELSHGISDIDTLLKLLADRDSLEASLYHDIVKSRLEAIKEFQKVIDEDQKEKVLQEYLFDHLWLLDSSWERATGSALMESRLKSEGVITDDMTKKEELGRVDIKYRTTAGKHLIVELKRAGRKMKLIELQNQGQTYADKLEKILCGQNESAPNIEVIFVIGKPVDEESSNPNRVKSSMNAVSPGSRIIHYDTLIKGAQEAYCEYLERNNEVDKLENFINKL